MSITPAERRVLDLLNRIDPDIKPLVHIDLEQTPEHVKERLRSITKEG